MPVVRAAASPPCRVCDNFAPPIVLFGDEGAEWAWGVVSDAISDGLASLRVAFGEIPEEEV